MSSMKSRRKMEKRAIVVNVAMIQPYLPPNRVFKDRKDYVVDVLQSVPGTRLICKDRRRSRKRKEDVLAENQSQRRAL